MQHKSNPYGSNLLGWTVYKMILTFSLNLNLNCDQMSSSLILLNSVSIHIFDPHGPIRSGKHVNFGFSHLNKGRN